MGFGLTGVALTAATAGAIADSECNAANICPVQNTANPCIGTRTADSVHGLEADVRVSV